MSEAGETAQKPGALRNVVTIFGAIVVAVALLAMFAVADGQMFEDAEFSRLYAFTLEQAYSRFKASDKQVPARAPAADPLDEMMAGAAGVSRPQRPAGVPPGRAQGTPRYQLPVKGSQAGSQYRLPVGQGSAPAPQQPGGHVHDDGGPHTQQGNEHLRKREYEQAVREFQPALQENPRRTLARHSLGDALRFLKREDEAIAAYREVLKQNPQYYCCYTHIGDIEKARENSDAAEKAYASAIEGYTKQLEQGGSIASIAKYHLAKLYSDLNRDLSQALTLAEQADTETPNNLSHVQLLAQLYEKLGRTQDAMRMYDKLAEISPQHVDYFRQQKERLMKPAPPASPPTP